MGGNRELITYRLTRARETLEEARLMAASEHWHGCVNRLYYAVAFAEWTVFAKAPWGQDFIQ